ncbi:D-alanyl-D-alanine carboxypeptidase [Croceivirga sp. JEA036]|uniref:D-alanyl-D-alanine carboxypeptidase n=1 Tax=Croceivirga sp. JEA036 TaxID=2721162 RepID=UPI00293BE1E0|nr:D-alanyl-D-alanine carboxypeptidase [Croceivirga sp. JEA036]
MLLINLKQNIESVINQYFTIRLMCLLLIVLLLTNCTTPRIQRQNKKFIVQLNHTETKQEFTGVLVVNAQNGDTLLAYNHKPYFIPASTTKLFTFYTAATTLPKKLPALVYTIKNDTLYIKGTGDPTWRHPYFKDSTALSFLKQFKTIRIVKNYPTIEPFGPGWAWEDYPYYFSAERSSMPMYGNVIGVSTKTGEESVTPALFKENITFKSTKTARDQHWNRFYIKKIQQKTRYIYLLLFQTACNWRSYNKSTLRQILVLV